MDVLDGERERGEERRGGWVAGDEGVRGVWGFWGWWKGGLVKGRK